MNASTFGDRVIDPTVTAWPIQSTRGDRWKMFLASATDLNSQSRPNPSSILAKRWASQRMANPTAILISLRTASFPTPLRRLFTSPTTGPQSAGRSVFLRA